MRISCSTKWASNMPLPEAVAAVGRAGFDAVDLVVPARSSAEDLERSLAENSLQLAGVVSGEALASETARETAALVRDLGMSSFIAWAGHRREQSIAQFAEQLGEILEGLNGYDIELVNRAGSRLEQLGDFRELFIRVPDPRLRVVIDTLEFHRASVNPRIALDELGDRCRRLVLADGVADRQVLLGQGEVNVRWLIDQLYRRAGAIEWLVVNPAVSSANSAIGELVAERRRLQTLLVGS